MAAEKQWFITDRGFDWMRRFAGFSVKAKTKRSRNLLTLLNALGHFAGKKKKSTLENVRSKAEESMSEGDALNSWIEARRRSFIQGV